MKKTDSLAALIVVASMIGGMMYADDYRPRPPQQPAAEAGNVGQEAPAADVDTRPVVEVECLPRDRCIPCARFDDWLKENADDFPIRFKVNKHTNVLPNRVYRNNLGLPSFFATDASGKLVCWDGWQGPEYVLQMYKAANPEFGKAAPVGAAAPAGAQNIADMFAKFAGPGRFSWKPDRPVKAYVDESTMVEYSALNGTAKIVNGQPSLTLEAPYPVVHVKKWGVWVNVNLLGADSQLDAKPQAVTLRHSRGTYRLVIQEGGK